MENDKLVLVDRYYTSGLFLSYKKGLDNDFLFKKDSTNVLQLNITLGNETYTPGSMETFNTLLYDRPFAGWMFLRFEVGNAKEESAFFVSTEMGITGEESQSGHLQVWFHDLMNIYEPAWFQELEFKFLTNLKAKYVLSKKLSERNGLEYEGEIAIGTKDIYLSNGVVYVFGRFNKLNNSARMGIIGKEMKNEWFGFISLGHKYVFHNTLIQGSLDYEDELFTSKIENHILKFKLGTVLKIKRTTIKLSYNFNTKETPRSVSHAYGTLSLSKDF